MPRRGYTPSTRESMRYLDWGPIAQGKKCGLEDLTAIGIVMSSHDFCKPMRSCITGPTPTVSVIDGGGGDAGVFMMKGWSGDEVC